VKRETALGLYKGLGAVMTGIIPKMAIRFTSYEWYKQMLADKEGNVASKSTFMGTSEPLQIQMGVYKVTNITTKPDSPPASPKQSS
jgi:hypothetical protein